MGRIEWLKWVVRYGTPNTRSRQVRLFFAFEFYRLCCRLCGYRITHWLDTDPLPAGKYLLVRRRAPLAVRLLDKAFPFEEEAHVKHVPYTPEAEEEIKKSGKPVELVEIKYQLKQAG